MNSDFMNFIKVLKEYNASDSGSSIFAYLNYKWEFNIITSALIHLSFFFNFIVFNSQIQRQNKFRIFFINNSYCTYIRKPKIKTLRCWIWNYFFKYCDFVLQ